MFKSRKFAILGSFGLFLFSAFFPTYHGHLQELSFHPSTSLEEELAWVDFINQFDDYFEGAVQNSTCPGLAVSIVKGNSTLLEKGYGYSSAKTKKSVDEHTLFRLASNSKGMTSTLAGVLVNKGLLNWDDYLVDYLPSFKLKEAGHAEKIQIKHILSHSAGFPYHTYTNLVEAKVDMEKIMDEMAKVQPIAPPGEIYSYQNAAYSLIGEAIEARTGEDIHTNLKKHLFEPLEMDDASTLFADLMACENQAEPHVQVRGGWAPIRQKDIYYNAVPAGGINASISDMTKYLKALLGYSNELPPHILDDLFTPQIHCPATWKYFRGWHEVKDLDYGLGWRIVNYNGRQLVYHGGYIKGFRSEILLDPNEDIAICLLTNSGSSFPKKSLRKFLNAYYAQKDVVAKT